MAAFHHSCSIRWISSVSTARRWRNSNPLPHLRGAKPSAGVRSVLAPQCVLAEARHKLAVRHKFGFAQPQRQALGSLTYRDDTTNRNRHPFTVLGKTELRLTCTGQFDIDLGQNLGIKQRAVFG